MFGMRTNLMPSQGLASRQTCVLKQLPYQRHVQSNAMGMRNGSSRNTRPTQSMTMVEPAQPGFIQDSPTSSNKSSAAGLRVPGVSALHDAWQRVDIKQKIVLACSLGFCLSNMDKTNFTVAVIPMAASYGWTPTIAGLVQSSFFYGFLLMQLPGGFLSTKLGGAFVLPRGLAVWSGATAAIPAVAADLPALCATRAIMGAGEAVAPSSIIDMITRTVPASERAGAVSFAFSGLHLGSIIGLLVSPAIIQTVDWPVLFYLFGGVGCVWLVWFHGIMEEVKQKDSELAARLFPASQLAATSSVALATNSSSSASVPVAAASPPPPYRAFLRSRPVRVLMFTHFCHNWFHYTMLSWLPTMFTSTLSIDLMHAAQTALLPPAAGIVASACAGTMANKLIGAGMPIPAVRKLAQTMGFLVPTACLAVASQVPCTPEDSATAVACITGALGMSSFSLAGLYCSHGDLSPKYSAALLGLTNVAGSVPGIIGVACVGALLEQTHDWSTALFLPSAAFMLAGTVAYVGFGRNDPIDFDAEDNSELPVERVVKSWWAASPVGRISKRVGHVAANAFAAAQSHIQSGSKAHRD